jgi:chemotaxis response regulator CheB
VVGVLLSGTGADGVRGCIAIKAQKGLTLVQAPEEAKFPMMPINALRHDDIDVALPVERLADIVAQLAEGREADPADAVASARRWMWRPGSAASA